MAALRGDISFRYLKQFFLVFSLDCTGFRVMVFNTIFSNISVISWRSVLFVEETGVLDENSRPSMTNLIT
jgi:hypothetical protein